MSMANNHSLGFGPQGLADTKAALISRPRGERGRQRSHRSRTVTGVRVVPLRSVDFV
jgi:hypothetical protein